MLSLGSVAAQGIGAGFVTAERRAAMKLELTDVERQALREILENYLSDLSVEIADTDSMDYREALKHKREVVKKVLAALGQDAPAG